MSVLDAQFESTLISISSSARDEDYKHHSAESFVYSLPNHIREMNEVYACQVVSAHVPNTGYNISVGSFYFKYTTIDNSLGNLGLPLYGEVKGFIPVGWYDYDSLIQALVTAYNAIASGPPTTLYRPPLMDANASFVDDTLTYKTTLTFFAQPDLIPSSGSQTISVATEDAVEGSEITNEVLHHLGWPDTINQNFASTGSFTSNSVDYTNITEPMVIQSPFLADLTGNKVININCPELASNAKGLPPLLVTVPMNSEFGAVANYSPPSDGAFIHQYRSARSFTTFTLQLVSADGRTNINIGNQEWGIVIKFWFAR